MFDFIAEIIAQIVIEIIGDFLLAFGANTIGRALASKTGHMIATAMVTAAVGLGGGYVWGLHVADIGRRGVPRTIWVSLALAALATAFALMARSHDVVNEHADPRFRTLPKRLRPTVGRLVLLVLLNVTIAAGVATGFYW